MVALITGGTGFIGAEVAHVLLERGESDVAVFSRSSSTQRLYDVADQIEFIQGMSDTSIMCFMPLKMSNLMLSITAAPWCQYPQKQIPPPRFRRMRWGRFMYSKRQDC